MTIDYENKTWFYNENPNEIFDFELVEPKANMCCGLMELSVEETNRLNEFLKTIPENDGMPGLTNLIEHIIDTGDSKPVKQRYYSYSPKLQDAVYSEVDILLKYKIIEPSKSSWSSPIVMIRKPDGTYRLCLDFRVVNNLTKKDAYPLPKIDSILQKLRKAKYISKIDINKGFLNIPLDLNSREKTAFTVPGRGLYQFTRMPFGLTNAPATFQRLIDSLVGPEMEPNVFTYLDDFIIVTETFDDHLIWLNRIVKKIFEANLSIN